MSLLSLHLRMRCSRCCRRVPQEFRRLDSQLGAARDRAELLAGGADTLPLLSVQVQSGTGALLRERATLNTSTNYVSDNTSTAEKHQRQRQGMCGAPSG